MTSPLNDNSIQNFRKTLRLLGKRPSTVESYARDASSFVEYLNSEGVNYGDVSPDTLVLYQDHLKENLGERNNSIRRSVIGIRQFFRFLSIEDGIPSGSPLDLVPIPPREEDLPESINDEDLDHLFDQARLRQPALMGARDGAILSLLGLEGIKAGELIELGWTDFLKDGQTGTLKIGGSRSRVIQLDIEATLMLSFYQEEYRAALPDVNPGKYRMFVSFKGRDKNTPMPNLTRHGLKFLLYELGDKAGVPGINTERLRHHATRFLLERGKTPEQIMHHFGLRRIGNIGKHAVDFARNQTEIDQNS